MNWLSDKTIAHLRDIAELPDLTGTKYALIRKLGQGGMGTVYLAEDTELDRPLALKVLSLSDSEGELAGRMLREARIVARLEHPGIVPIHDVGMLPDRRVFYAMKFVQGKRLDEYLSERIPLSERLQIFRKICDAVAFAHQQKVVHRDLKPENIMVGSFGEILVMDWGLAKLLAADTPDSERQDLRPREERGPLLPANETLHGTVLGTPQYMAPEQTRGEIDRIDARTDVYALGAILSFMLRATETLSKVEEQPSMTTGLLRAGRPKIPKPLAAICARAMAEEPDRRYSSALQLAEDVDRFISGLAVSSYRENIVETAWRRLKQYRFMVFLILAYLLVRYLLFFWFRR